MEIDQDSAQVRIPPPFWLALAIGIGAGIHHFYPIEWISGRTARWIVAALSGCLSVGLLAHCFLGFLAVKTDVKPWKTTSALVFTGAYRFSRNPMYLAFLLAGVCFAAAINTAWIAVLLIPLFFILEKLVISKEEAYLEQKFGQTYRDYKKKIRRWI